MADATAKLLVVDASSKLGNWCSGCLQEDGHEVVYVQSGPEAFRAMSKHQPDLVLLSYDLVRNGGERITHGIRVLSDKPGLPMVLYSANKDHDTKDLKHIYNQILSTPIDRESLLLSVSQCLPSESLIPIPEVSGNSNSAARFINHCVAPSVRDVFNQLSSSALQCPQDLNQVQQEVVATALFADIRGFTRLTEAIEGKEVIAMLNRYYTFFTERTEFVGGSVLSMAGDRLMACFGVPTALDKPVDAALITALSVQQRFSSLRTHIKKRFDIDIGLGIGIDHGPMLAGFLGSKTQIQYTVIGHSVNFAARLEGIAPSGAIVLSDAAKNQLESCLDRLNVKTLNDFSIRGVMGAQTVHCIQTD